MLPNPMDLFLALSSFSTSFFLSLFLFFSAFTRHVYQHQSIFSYSSVFSFWNHSCKIQTTISLHTQWLHQEQNLPLCTKSSNLGSIDILTQGLRPLTQFLWDRAFVFDTRPDSTMPKLNFDGYLISEFLLPPKPNQRFMLHYIHRLHSGCSAQTNKRFALCCYHQRGAESMVLQLPHCTAGSQGSGICQVFSDQFSGHSSACPPTWQGSAEGTT